MLTSLFLTDDLVGEVIGEFCTGPSGEINAIGDYSSAVTRFTIEIDPNITFVIARITVHLSLGMKVSEVGYAASMNKLTKGITAEATREKDGQDIAFYQITTAQIPVIPATATNIKANVDYGRYTSIDIMSKERSYDAIWDFTRNKKPLVLRGGSNDKLSFLLNDDFSDGGLNLLEHTFYASGYIL